MRILAFSVAAFALTGAAAAFDTSTCGTFLAATWATEPVTKGRHVTRFVMSLGSDGTYFITIEDSEDGGPVDTTKLLDGPWSAKAGSAAESCTLTLGEGSSATISELTVNDETSITSSDGTLYRKQ
jgi:hypothetical protein